MIWKKINPLRFYLPRFRWPWWRAPIVGTMPRVLLFIMIWRRHSRTSWTVFNTLMFVILVMFGFVWLVLLVFTDDDGVLLGLIWEVAKFNEELLLGDTEETFRIDCLVKVGKILATNKEDEDATNAEFARDLRLIIKKRFGT